MRRRRALLAALPVAIAAISLLVALHASHRDADPGPVTIPHGAGSMRVGQILSDADVISSRPLFLAAVVLSGARGRLQSGTYLFPNPVSTDDVVRILTEGSHQVETPVSVPEGITLKRIASLLARRTRLDSARIAALCTDRTFIRSFGIEAPSLEGYLEPDTYNIRYDATARQTIARMVRERLQNFGNADRARMRALHRSLREILTMASIVEGETRKPEERARIAGVYYNRLRRGMPLQADPTVQYAIPDGPRRLLYRDLDIASPYNTYRVRGLPPGPINNPGRAAIHASLYPESHGYLYFVADGTGGHVFSRTLREHAAAVKAYRQWLSRTGE